MKYVEGGGGGGGGVFVPPILNRVNCNEEEGDNNTCQNGQHNNFVLFIKMRDKINQKLVYSISRKKIWNFFWLSD